MARDPADVLRDALDCVHEDYHLNGRWDLSEFLVHLEVEGYEVRPKPDARFTATALFDAAIDFFDHRGIGVPAKVLADLCDHLAAEVRPKAEGRPPLDVVIARTHAEGRWYARNLQPSRVVLVTPQSLRSLEGFAPPPGTRWWKVGSVDRPDTPTEVRRFHELEWLLDRTLAKSGLDASAITYLDGEPIPVPVTDGDDHA